MPLPESYPEDLKYTDQHEWIRIEGDVGEVGLTWYAQDQLGDVVHYEPPEVGAEVSKGGAVGEVESVKAVSDVYSPVSGEIVDVNEDLDGNEEAINRDPYGEGWLFRIRLSRPAEVHGLMDAAAYERHVSGLG